MQTETISFCKHMAGQGLHFINDNSVSFPDDSFQFGDTSDPYVLTNLGIILDFYQLPPLWEVWGSVYPDDPLDQDDAVFLISQSLPFMERCDPSLDVVPVLTDLIAIGQEKLAAFTSYLLVQKGVL